MHLDAGRLRDGLRLLRERRRRAQAAPRPRRDRRRRCSSAASRLDEGEKLRNVVYMGMGEPLHNYESTARSLRLLTHPDGIGLSTRRVTISTSGLVPEIERLGADFGGNVGLAISLHAADDETRSRADAHQQEVPAAELMDALRAYPLPKRRRITIEYTLVAGQERHRCRRRRSSRSLLRGLPVKVNLIPMNPIEASDPRTARLLTGVLDFQKVLCDAGLLVLHPPPARATTSAAACGQLALLGAKPKVRVNRT